MRLSFNVSVDTEGYTWSSRVKLGGKCDCATQAFFAIKIRKKLDQKIVYFCKKTVTKHDHFMDVKCVQIMRIWACFYVLGEWWVRFAPENRSGNAYYSFAPDLVSSLDRTVPLSTKTYMYKNPLQVHFLFGLCLNFILINKKLKLRQSPAR